MRRIEEVHEVLRLVAAGLNDCEISRRTGLPRTTIRDWRGGGQARLLAGGPTVSCPVCGHPAHDHSTVPGPSYAYLLGQYLGDGTISSGQKGVYRLRIICCLDYLNIVMECARAMGDVLPDNRVGIQVLRSHAAEVHAYSKQLICLFPQAGPGRKHERKIELAGWQQRIVDEHPQQFLRGLIHSDGCRFINRIRHPNKTYEYPRYCLTNASRDIRGLFCATCDQLGIEWRQMNARNISVARRDSVARMDEFIGPKR
jgi:hypothetical protein